MTVTLRVEHDGSEPIIQIHQIKDNTYKLVATLGKNEVRNIVLHKNSQLIIKEVE